MLIDDTIAAIATAVGESGISVVRVSGSQAIAEVSRISRSKVKLTDAQSHTVHYGTICDPGSKEQIEEVLFIVMQGPRSFTAEDVVEIHTHGGYIAVKRVLDLLLQCTAVRLAEPGEFTKRAFLNGRIDLVQAEAVIDLIRAKSDRAHSMAMRQTEGSLSTQIRTLRQHIIEMIAHIEVNIDYPEHDVAELTLAYIVKESQQTIGKIDSLLQRSAEGKIVREGIMTAIVGRPNVGKSSLMNVLAQEAKAIVTDIPGTTRDIIEEYITLGGIPLRLLDTAGIRVTDDLVEQIGVQRSKQAIDQAELVILVLNGAEPLQEEDFNLFSNLKNKTTLVLINKADLHVVVTESQIRSMLPEAPIVTVSMKNEFGLSDITTEVQKLFFTGHVEVLDQNIVSNARHIALLHAARQSLVDAIEGAESGIPIDLVQIDVRLAWEQLGEIVGENISDTLIDQIFSQFCLGK